MPNDLTRRQNDLLLWVEHREQSGLAPATLDEACAGLGLSSRGSLHKHVNALVEMGYLLAPEGRHLGLRLRQSHLHKASTRMLPFFGRIAAGTAIDATDVRERFEVPAHLAASDSCYVLEVQGDSMIGIGILDGDWVIIEPRHNYARGEVVVALIDRSEVTLKRLEYADSLIVLQPENDTMSAMTYAPERVEFQGRLVAQMRTY